MSLASVIFFYHWFSRQKVIWHQSDKVYFCPSWSPTSQSVLVFGPGQQQISGDTTQLRLVYVAVICFEWYVLKLSDEFSFSTAPLGVGYEYLECRADNYPCSIGAFSFQTPWSLFGKPLLNKCHQQTSTSLISSSLPQSRFQPRLLPYPSSPMCACGLMFVFNECLMSAW